MGISSYPILRRLETWLPILGYLLLSHDLLVKEGVYSLCKKIYTLECTLVITTTVKSICYRVLLLLFFFIPPDLAKDGYSCASEYCSN